MKRLCLRPKRRWSGTGALRLSPRRLPTDAGTIPRTAYNDRLWLNPGSASYRRPDDRDKRAHYMLIEDGDIRFGAVEYDRSAMLARAMDYVKKGTMLETDLQDAMFFFGDAPTSREPLPR